MECSVSEKKVCEPPSTLHEMLMAVAVALIFTDHMCGRSAGGLGMGPPVHRIELAATVPVGRRPDAVYETGLSCLLQRLSASLLWYFPLGGSVLLLARNSWTFCSAMAFLRNLSLTHKDVVNETFPVAALVLICSLTQ